MEPDLTLDTDATAAAVAPAAGRRLPWFVRWLGVIAVAESVLTTTGAISST
jgi:hypothetical protein